MHSDYLPEEDSSSAKLFSRGVSVYYLGSTIFVAGIALIILGTALIMVFQLHYESEPEQILYTVVSVATGITLILIGINLMMKQTRKGYIIVGISTVSSSLAIFLFTTNYLQNWYYPLVGYIFGLYVIGFLILLGNSFASVIVWIIGNKPDFSITGEEKPRLYTDEEIQRDIEEATKKSIESAVAELQFELEEFPDDILIGKSAPEISGNIIRVKDDISEVLSLKQTLTPGTTEKWGSVGIEKASMQLSETMTQEKKKKSIFARFMERFSRKKIKSKKLSKQTKENKEMERKKQEEIEAKRKKMEAIKEERELRKKKIEEETKKKLELKKAKREAEIKERAIKKRKIEEAAKKRAEIIKAKREAEIKERKAREKAIARAKYQELEAKKALKEAKLKKKELSKKNKK